MLRVVAGCVLLAGCTTGEPGPTPPPTVDLSPVAPTPGADAELLCGIDRVAIETITGYAPDRSDGDLTVHDGVGTGRCSVWTEDERHSSEEILIVWLVPVSSEEGAELRQRVDGELENPPAVVYPRDAVDGAYWETPESSSSRVSWGETIVDVHADNLRVRVRERSDDLLAVSQQVAATLGLEGVCPEPGSATWVMVSAQGLPESL
jgi:hypothetical protein